MNTCIRRVELVSWERAARKDLQQLSVPERNEVAALPCVIRRIRRIFND